MNRRTVQSYAVLWVVGPAFVWWPWALVRTFADTRPTGRRLVALVIVTACLVASLLGAVVRGGESLTPRGRIRQPHGVVHLMLVLSRQRTRSHAGDVIRSVVDLTDDIDAGNLVPLAIVIAYRLVQVAAPSADTASTAALSGGGHGT